jgi:hypothetical protein
MKRDMELIRTILLRVEEDPKFDGSFQGVDAISLRITDQPEAEVRYQLVLLVEAGFLIGNVKLANTNLPVFGPIVVARLTWQGHEFLDDIRDPQIWGKTKERAKAVASVGFGFLWEIAKAEIKTKLGLP